MGFRQWLFFRAEEMVSRYTRVGSHFFFDTNDFPWCADLERATPQIRRELLAVLSSAQAVPRFQDISPEQTRITKDDGWRTFLLSAYGRKIRKNCDRCPQTAKALQAIPGMRTAFFSILSPGKEVPFHRGPYNGVLRYHLGLIVPEGGAQCAIVVGPEQRRWAEGSSLIFDDSHLHRAWNRSGSVRVVLFVDFVRPLQGPASILNWLYIQMMSMSQAARKTLKLQKDWEKGKAAAPVMHG